MRKKVTIIIIITIIISAIIAICCLKNNSIFKYEHAAKTRFLNDGNTVNSENSDNIYFFHTGYSDCMLIESNGHYGLVDSSNRYSQTITDSNGAEYSVTQHESLSNQDYFYSGKDVANYIVNALGVDHIDFVIGTHAHSDHIGGVEEICSQKLSNGNYLIDNRTHYFYKTYYHVNDINDDLDENGNIITRTGSWHNQAFVYRAVKSMQDRGAKIINVSNGVKISSNTQTVFPDISSISGNDSHLTNSVYQANDLNNYYDDYISFNFGNYNIRLYNLFTGKAEYDENVNSILTLITKADTSILLTGDVDIGGNTEVLLAEEIHNYIGEIDLYKTAHHSSNYSNSKEVYDYLKPKYCVSNKGNGDPKAYLCERHYANKKYGTNFYETQLIDKAVVANIGNDNITFYELYDENNNSNNRDTYNPMYRELEPRNIWRDGSASGWFDWKSYNYNNWMYLEEDGNSYKIRTGWININGYWYYADEDGLIQYGWNYINNEWYYFAGFEEIKKEDNSYYPEGAMVEGWQWLKLDNNSYWFYFTPEPYSIKKEGSDEYYPEGAMVEGWQYINYQGKNRYFYLSKGLNDIEGYPRGAMITGKHNVEYNGNKYYFYFCKETGNPTGYVMGEMLSNITYEGDNYNSSGVLIDNTAPEITVEYSTTNPTNQNVTVTLTANEEVQEIEGWTREENRKALTKEYEQNTTEQIIIKDLVGNSSTVTIEITNIDKAAPIGQVAYSTTNPTNQNVTVTITANEEIQEIEGWTREENRKALTKEYSENKTEEITIKDLVGNETKVNVEITNIDKTGTGMIGVNVTNWITLKNEIENTEETDLVINLTNNESNNWTVDSKIVISSEQKVKLVVKENIIAKRAEGFLDCFIENNGTLEIVPENENIYLIFDGNKEIVANSTGSLIEVYNGHLNMKNTILRNNKKVASGGGMYVKDSQMIFDNVQIIDNEGKGGGGVIILNNSSDTQLNNVIIDNNKAISSSGGGIYAYGKLKITGERTRISNNTAKTLGGGIMIKNECMIEDGEISGNAATESAGGGIRVDGKLTLNGGNIKNNFANIGGGGIDYNSGMFFYNNGTVENNQSNNASNYKFPNADIYPDLKYNVDWTQDESLNIYRIKPSVMKSYIRGTDIVDRSTQGMTRTDKYIIFTSWKTNEDDTILNIVDRNSLRVLNSIGGFEFKHANGMTYNSKTGYVYILPTTKNLVKFKINDETYAIEDLSYIECTRIYSGIAYDEDDDCYIAYADGKIYILDSNYNEISSFDLIMQLTAQEVAYYNGHIYFMSFEAGNNSSHQVHSFNNKERLSSLIYEYDFEGNLIRSLYISREDYAGELESGYFEENGDLVVSYNITLNSKETISLLKSDIFGPGAKVEYSESKPTNQNVTVTITANEEIQEIEGWTREENRKVLTKEYSENKTEEITIKDLVGNETKVNVEINNIDKIAPTANVEYSEANPTNQNVTVTITANEEIQEIEGWTKKENRKELTKEYSENKTEEITIKDLAGNETKANLEIANIDKVAPTANVEYSTTALTNQNVTVTITSNEEVQEIEGWIREENRKVLTKEYSENKTEEITIKDLVGNESKVNVEIANIDKVVPTANVEYSTTALTNQNVTVTITTNEEIQEVEGWTRKENRKVITKEYSENKTEEITIKDLAGNETKVNVEITNIDKIAPKIEGVKDKKSYSRKATPRAVDDNLERVTLEKEGQVVEGYENGTTITELGTYKITAIDKVGNKTEVEFYIKDIPSTKEAVEYIITPEGPTNQDVKVSVTKKEDEEYHDFIVQMSIDGENYEAIMEKTITENGIVYVRIVKEEEGNTIEAEELEIEINNIDKIAPKAQVVYSTTNPTNQNVTVTINTNEEIQEIEGWTRGENRKSITKEYEQNTTEEITIKDLAGNTSNVAIEITNIDKTAPEAQVTYSNKELTKENVTATITTNEEIQEVEGWTRGEDRKQLTKEYSENKTEEITVKDLAGNTTKVAIEITNIDKTAPEGQVTYSETNPTNKNVTATITANEEIQEVEGWTISQDKKKLTKEYNENKTEKVIIKDKIGNEKEVDVKVLNIDRTKPVVSVTYSTKNKTNKNVTVTITANEKVQEITGWTLLSDKKKLTKEYSVNKTETITIKDLAGNISNVAIEITNIDKIAPEAQITYSEVNLTNQNVTVIITANEEIQGITGWTLSNDKKTLTKTYQNNIEETIQVKDLAGNTADKNISIRNIDKTKPEIEGVENANSYNDSVIITVTDTNPGTLLLEKDGEKVEGYTNGKEIIQEGVYKLTAVDKLGNTTIVNFTIKYVRGDLNKDSKIDMLDVLTILKHISQEKKTSVANKHPEWKLSEKGKIVSDTDKNGKVEMLDVLKILQYIAAKTKERTAQKHPEWLNLN